MKYTISQKHHTIKDANRNNKVVIYKDDILELTFIELYKYLKTFNNNSVSDKIYGLPKLYQIPRKNFDLDYILQTDNNYKEDYINTLTLDYDSNVSREFVEKQLINFEYISYYSYNHNVKEGCRFRILLNLKSNVKTSIFNQHLKKQILTNFSYEGDLPDLASIKDGFMYLPSLYDGIRTPELKYNTGDKFDLNSEIDKINVEMSIKSKTKSQLNNKINDEKGFNNQRQIQTFEELKEDLLSTTTNKHNALITFISKSSWIGIEQSEIRNVIYDYETNESKLDNWIQLISDWNKDDVISYYYRYEYKVFKGEYFLFDNLKCLYKDIIQDKWLVKKPRNKKQDYKDKIETDNLFKLLYQRTGDFPTTVKLYDFITTMMEKYNPNDMITSNKYKQQINKGVAFSKKVYQIIMFDIFKFRELNKINNESITSITELLSMDYSKDDQTIMLEVINELVWVRREKVFGDNGYYGWKTYFSPKQNLLKILGE